MSPNPPFISTAKAAPPILILSLSLTLVETLYLYCYEKLCASQLQFSRVWLIGSICASDKIFYSKHIEPLTCPIIASSNGLENKQKIYFGKNSCTVYQQCICYIFHCIYMQYTFPYFQLFVNGMKSNIVKMSFTLCMRNGGDSVCIHTYIQQRVRFRLC